MLTTKCPNSCDWCFAQSQMQQYQSKNINEIKWEDFLKVVDFYKKSGLNNIILLGCEPTLHSNFMDILAYLHKENFRVSVSTNGIIDSSLIEKIAAFGIKSLSFGLNTTSYFDYDSTKLKKVNHFLAEVKTPVSLAYTITEKDINNPRLEPMLDRIYLIMRYSLLSQIQFQIAVPSLENKYFIPFDRYKEIVPLIDKWATALNKNNIKVGFDCHSFPKCALSNNHRFENLFYYKCNNFMIDIGPDLSVWPCFPLSDYKVKLDEFENFFQIQKYFKTKLSNSLIYDESCNNCNEKKKKNVMVAAMGFGI